MGILLWVVGGLVVVILIAVVVDHVRGPSGPIDHAGLSTSNRSGKGHDTYNWPTGSGLGGDA